MRLAVREGAAAAGDGRWRVRGLWVCCGRMRDFVGEIVFGWSACGWWRVRPLVGAAAGACECLWVRLLMVDTACGRLRGRALVGAAAGACSGQWRCVASGGGRQCAWVRERAAVVVAAGNRPCVRKHVMAVLSGNAGALCGTLRKGVWATVRERACCRWW